MRRALPVALLVLAAAACSGGGGSSSGLPEPGHGGTTSAASPKDLIRVTFPSVGGSGSTTRRPAILTPNTASFSLVVYTAGGATPNPQPTPLAIQLTNSQFCTSSDGSTTCTVSFPVPVATAVVIEIQTFDANGNLIDAGFIGPIDTTQSTIPAQTFAPIVFSPTSLSLSLGGSAATVIVSQSGYAGAFTVSGSSSVATVTCVPANCTPSSAGGNVTISVAPGTTAGSEMVSISNAHGFANLPVAVTSSSGGAPIVGAPNIREYATAAGGTNYGITVGPDGSSLWFVDRANSTIGAVANPANCSGTTCANSDVPNPQPTTATALQSITSASDGNIYYTGAATPTDSGAIFQVSCNSVTPSCNGSNFYTSNGNGVNDIVSAPDGYLYATSGSTLGGSAYVLNGPIANCCSFYDDGSVSGVPNFMALEPSGANMWFTDTGSAQVGYFPIPCNTYCGMAEEPSGSTYGGGLRHRNPSTAPRRRDHIVSVFTAPLNGIVAGPDGNMYMAEAGSHRIDQLNPSNWTTCVSSCSFAFTTIALPQTGALPQSLTVGPDGNIWFTDTTGYIGVISVSSCATACKAYEYAVGGAPWGITKGPDGNIWFTDSSTNKIGEVVLQ
jgi:streptogramin lyase